MSCELWTKWQRHTTNVDNCGPWLYTAPSVHVRIAPCVLIHFWVNFQSVVCLSFIFHLNWFASNLWGPALTLSLLSKVEPSPGEGNGHLWVSASQRPGSVFTSTSTSVTPLMSSHVSWYTDHAARGFIYQTTTTLCTFCGFLFVFFTFMWLWIKYVGVFHCCHDRTLWLHFTCDKLFFTFLLVYRQTDFK